MKKLTVVLIAITVVILAGLGYVYGGVFNVAADVPHWGVTSQLLETVRERSIAVRAGDIDVPPLEDAAMIRRGAGNYDSMCVGCHLAPDKSDTEMSQGLYPSPPNLARTAIDDPARAFWIIKHGVKATGMPAWGKSMEDRHIWDMVALLRKLPTLSREAYEAEVAASGGHSHGGGETSDDHHSHDEQGSSADQSQKADHDHGEAGHDHEHGDAATGGAASAKPKIQEHSDDHSHSHDAHEQGTSTRAVIPAHAAEPVAVVERFFRELAAGNTNAASALLDPGVLIYESGRVERSRAEYASHHLVSDAKFLRSATHRLLSRTGDAAGDLAWVASEARLSADTDGRAVDVITTETIVLRKTAQGWRISHVHWSNRPAPRDA
jgi:ketosteroid isomerase-like protein/mono/diheme cytochrome c family protein